ncbi:uncharacterized protein LOC114256543 [Camellia sinensis]|uniref:uncharacterized protein LOC114256543 n=1 Tax=Camellia sinensis TaxID=4442 RepID=UPI001036C3BE|nr:uncharacterized protein LOC114256543 [Camellia sinensis]
MVGPPDMRRQDRRCEYHKDHGHDAESYYALKDHLEELIQDGRLQQFVRKGNSTKAIATRQDSAPLGVIYMIYSLQMSSVVHTIQSNPDPQNLLTPAKRPHEAASIAFDDSDLARVTLPHVDPLVIELRVNQFTVERVLIDPGSTSEVMYYKTFTKLGFSESDLSLTPYPLFGFNTNPEYLLGKITLPVQAGSRTVDVEFLAAKLPSPDSKGIPQVLRTGLKIYQGIVDGQKRFQNLGNAFSLKNPPKAKESRRRGNPLIL